MNRRQCESLTNPGASVPLRDQWDARGLRQTLGRFVTGVTVVTTRLGDGTCIGLTANSFNSVSLDPALVLWSLGKQQKSREAFRRCTHFAINILSASQKHLSQRFSSPIPDKFEGVDVFQDGFAAPLLQGCAAWFMCRNHLQYELGDHLLFIGEVQALGSGPEAPLVFHDGDYAIPRALAAAACGSPSPAQLG